MNDTTRKEMTVTEVKQRKVAFEKAIRQLVEEFEDATITKVKSVFISPSKKGQTDRVEAEIQIETFWITAAEAA